MIAGVASIAQNHFGAEAATFAHSARRSAALLVASAASFAVLRLAARTEIGFVIGAALAVARLIATTAATSVGVKPQTKTNKQTSGTNRWQRQSPGGMRVRGGCKQSTAKTRLNVAFERAESSYKYAIHDHKALQYTNLVNRGVFG